MSILRRFILPCLALWLWAASSSAQTLSPGDIAIVGMNSDDPDEFAFVALVDLPPGTMIIFANHRWQKSGSFLTTGDEYTYTTSTVVTRGTVVRVDATAGSPRFSTSGDQILAFQGTIPSPTFIYALNGRGPGVWQAEATDPSTSALPAGLQNGLTAVAVDERDNVVFAGPTTGTKSELLALIGDKTNWLGSLSRRQDLGLSFTVTGVSIPVFVNTLADTTIVANTFFSYTYNATDRDGDPLSYSITGQPFFASFNHSTGELRGMPPHGAEGDYPYTISVTDGTHTAETSTVVTLVRSLVPIAPYFTQGPNVVFAEPGELLTLAFAAEDPLGDPVTLCFVEIDCISFGSVLALTAPTEIGISQIIVVASVASGEATEKEVLIVVQDTLFEIAYLQRLLYLVGPAYAPTARTLPYDVARDTMYAVIDRDADGFVRGLYTDFAVELLTGDPSMIMVNGGINSEHVWPQSKGAGEQPQRSDLYNLFPAKGNVISSRGNHPFAEIPDNETESWFRLDETLSTIPSTNIDEYSEKRGSEFEPRESVKGDIARSMFYFFAVYNSVADTVFMADQLETLLNWDEIDAISADEIVRAFRIKQYQGNLNPFLLDPSLGRRMFRSAVGYLQNDWKTSHASGITLNEVSARSATDFNADGETATPGDNDEFIEIVNSSSDPVDINGWLVGDNNGYHTLTGLAPVDPTHSVILFTRGANTSNFDPGKGNQVVSVTHLALNNDIDAVGLRNLNGVVIALHWGSGPSSELNSLLFGEYKLAGGNATLSSFWRAGESQTRTPDYTGAWTRHPEITGIQNWSVDGLITIENPKASPGRTLTGLVLDVDDTELPFTTRLDQNYPNPFNSSTVISYTLPKLEHVRLEVYDLIGRRIRVLTDEAQPPGRHALMIDSKSLLSGTYFYRVRAGAFVETKMMTVVR